jgi:hypothetical protein
LPAGFVFTVCQEDEKRNGHIRNNDDEKKPRQGITGRPFGSQDERNEKYGRNAKLS